MGEETAEEAPAEEQKKAKEKGALADIKDKYIQLRSSMDSYAF